MTSPAHVKAESGQLVCAPQLGVRYSVESCVRISNELILLLVHAHCSLTESCAEHFSIIALSAVQLRRQHEMSAAPAENGRAAPPLIGGQAGMTHLEDAALSVSAIAHARLSVPSLYYLRGLAGKKAIS